MMEKVFRITQCLSEKGKTCINMGLVLPSKVVHLVIKRPRDFTFKPGDYAYINIPDIAKFQWHPFTISSAPEQSDMISLHVRAVGHWTNKLYEYFEAKQTQIHYKSNNVNYPEQHYDSFHISTIIAGREQVRRTSVSILRSDHRKLSMRFYNHQYVIFQLNSVILIFFLKNH